MYSHCGGDPMQLDVLSQIIDAYCVARELRLTADKEAAKLKAKETDLKNRVMQEMLNHDCHMVGGKYKKVTLRTKSKPQVASWPEVYAYIMEHDAPDLLQRRLAEGAVNERLTEGEAIPGVELIEINDLSVSKL